MTAVGHAHIDSAWLWPLRETRRKVARTPANVLTLMETDPELVYAMSSAQQYAWVQGDHPELFERVRQRVAEGRIVPVGGAPVWAGELYLELHRGTLTSQIAMKQGNRRAEALLRSVEYLRATSAVRDGVPYPYDELDEAWRTVLLHQFHDILPGSSISWVHREARETYARLEKQLRALAPTGGEPGWEVVRDRRAVPPGAGVLDNGILRASLDADGHVSSLTDLRNGRELAAGPLGVLRLFRDEPVRWDA
ncbi:hypothetical protein [Paractinoplanes maris]|uniref:glycoside hydrolase family 38 N-terminal domain-containing protein n=1 Tax=Paractinoplanes maris TaxID=1734446 RepID=UPI00201FE1EF|nr:hypothetical protein [Actinoplanes maris]